MKIIILLALLLFAYKAERHYAERFLISVSHLSHQIRLVNQSQNKNCMVKKLDHYLNKVDSTVAELRKFQRKYFCLEGQMKQLQKRYSPSRIPNRVKRIWNKVVEKNSAQASATPQTILNQIFNYTI